MCRCFSKNTVMYMYVISYRISLYICLASYIQDTCRNDIEKFLSNFMTGYSETLRRCRPNPEHAHVGTKLKVVSGKQLAMFQPHAHAPGYRPGIGPTRNSILQNEDASSRPPGTSARNNNVDILRTCCCLLVESVKLRVMRLRSAL